MALHPKESIKCQCCGTIHVVARDLNCAEEGCDGEVTLLHCPECPEEEWAEVDAKWYMWEEA